MKILSTVLLFLFSSLSMAEDVIDFEITINQMSSYYRAFVFFDGDDQYKEPLLSITAQASDFDELLKDKPELSSKWRAFIVQVYRGFEDESVVHNVNLQANWGLRNSELYNALSDEREKNAANKPVEDPLSEDYIRLIQLRMERILSAYMLLTNALGGLGVSAESIDLETQILKVSSMLTLLNPQDESLKRVIKKWTFIKRVLLKYNTSIAPYVVLHSYKKMRKDIGEHLVIRQ